MEKKEKYFLIAITKTCLYNFYPLKPHFYIVQGYTLLFLFLLKNIDCGYLLELPGEAVLRSTHNLCFEQKYEKYQRFLSENFQLLKVKFSVSLNRGDCVMTSYLAVWNIHQGFPPTHILAVFTPPPPSPTSHPPPLLPTPPPSPYQNLVLDPQKLEARALSDAYMINTKLFLFIYCFVSL